MSDMDQVRKDAAAQVEKDAAVSQAAQSAQAAQAAQARREEAEAEQAKQAKAHALVESQTAAAVDDARNAEKAAAKQADEDGKAAGSGSSPHSGGKTAGDKPAS